MDRNEVITRLCATCAFVREHLSRGERSYAADCFCAERSDRHSLYYQFEPAVMEFIEQAIDVAVKADIQTRSTHKGRG